MFSKLAVGPRHSTVDLADRARSAALPAHAGRFEALDSWRGVCACLVILFHFQVNSSIFRSPLIRNSYLFVDFFFVLSGFVICWNYGHKLASLRAARNFIVLRLGRLYPLHLFVLLCFVALEVLPALAGHSATYAAFAAGNRSLSSLLSNLLLVQSLGLHDDLTWNEPSWSICTEVWAYFAFALACVCFGLRRWQLLIAGIAAPVAIFFLSPHAINTTFDYGLIRCLYGFAIGAACCPVYRRMTELQSLAGLGRTTMTMIELAVVLSTVEFVYLCGDEAASILAPYVFAVVVVVFAFQAGAISRVLEGPVPRWLGERSYSIYMTHWLVWSVAGAGLKFAQNNVLHIDLWRHLNAASGQVVDVIGRNNGEGISAEVVLVAMTLLFSAFTYEFVERPGRDWTRRWVARHGGANAPVQAAGS